ncbi:MAG: hypothetical protein IT210_01805 [Armatimonadetes bacterium]|nr:hypothetical protein [Armatimonadota bacterium]
MSDQSCCCQGNQEASEKEGCCGGSGGGCNCGCSCGSGGCSCCGGGSCNCGCSCCGGSGGFQRRFITKGEKIARLEEYKKQLDLELQGVQEEIDRLNKN